MRVLPLLFVALLAAPCVASPVVSVKGRVLHDPLRLDDEDAAGLRYPEWLATLLERPAMAGEKATLYTRGQVVLGVSARSIADFKLTSASGDETLQADTRLAIYGVQGGQYLVTTVAKRPFLRGTAPQEMIKVGNTPTWGDRIGRALAPALAWGTSLRNARVFHPDGHTFGATVTPILSGEFDTTAKGMKGQALIRMGGGIWRQKADGTNRNLWDTLSLAIRFTGTDHALDSVARPGDQDLLVASWSERFHEFFWRSLPKTNQHDFLDNHYFPAMPYEVEGKPVWLRVIPVKVTTSGTNRVDKLRDAIKRGKARFYLEIQHKDQARWYRVARLDFTSELTEIDQKALHYHPHMDGKGITPTGTISAIRARVYKRSQAKRAEAAAAERKRADGITDQLKED